SGCSSEEHHFRCSHTFMAAPARAGQGFQRGGARPFCPDHLFDPDVHFGIVRQRANVAQLAWAAGARSAGAGGTEPASGALRRSDAPLLWFCHGFA
ncbi:hypothetical protein L7G72_01090, partial [Xenorhabdus bovienii]|uniref:hypothetical protein n=2 Tax=Xenorhabdus bovienii TaxID=40576 RepID=UPI0036F3E816|nr:hypothetical protein [Xenorhabdus bovienii]